MIQSQCFQVTLSGLLTIVLVFSVPADLLTAAPGTSGNGFLGDSGQPMLMVKMKVDESDSPPWVEGHRWDTPEQIQIMSDGQESYRISPERPIRLEQPDSVQSAWLRRILLIGLSWMGIVHVLLGFIVYFDLRSSERPFSTLWIWVVLFSGIPGMLIYVFWRWERFYRDGLSN